MPNLPPPPSGPTFEWSQFKDWLFKLWRNVAGLTFGGDTSSYSSAISASASAGDASQDGVVGSYSSNGSPNLNTVITSYIPTGSVVSAPYNPSGLGDWVTATGQNYNGLGVDMGGYGPRTFAGSTIPNIAAIEGATVVPAVATVPANGIGVSGYVQNSSTLTNAVGLYGQADVEATNALVWGVNSVSADNGFQTTVWGAEFDVNLSNVNSVCKGVDIVGGSSVEPAVTIGLRIGPLGTFASPPKRWARGILIDDGSSIIGIEMGAANLNTTSQSLPLKFFYYNGSNVRTQGFGMFTDSSGNTQMTSILSSGLFVLQTGANKQLQLGAGAGIGFFNTFPVGQSTGWGTPTGTGIISNFPGASATLAQCSQEIATIISLLKAFGLFGA